MHSYQYDVSTHAVCFMNTDSFHQEKHMDVSPRHKNIFLSGGGSKSLLWRQNGRGSVSNHQPHDCLLKLLFRRRSKKTSKLRVTGLCERNSPGAGEFPAQRASNAENVSIWWRHHLWAMFWIRLPSIIPCYNGHDGVSNHRRLYCSLNRLFRRWSKKASKLRVTDLCEGNSPGAGEVPAQGASNAENVSIWWRHHVTLHGWMWNPSDYTNASSVRAGEKLWWPDITWYDEWASQPSWVRQNISHRRH